MSDPNNTRLAYFETDQIKYAVQLWKLVKATRGNEFDVLRFTQNWAYAEEILARALIAEDEGVSNLAVELMQIRMMFVEQYPERAAKMGARDIAGALVNPVPPARLASAAIKPALEAAHDLESLNRRYLKGLR